MTQRTSSFLALLLITLPIARAAAQQSPWRKLPLPGGGNVEVFAGEGEHLYVKTGDVIHRSTDGGETWSAGGAIDTWVNVMRLDRAGNIYAGTSGSLHRSTDQGSTWAHLPWSAGDVWDVAFNSNGGIFVATETSFVQYSTDNGATWKIVGAAEMGPVWSIAVDARSCGGNGLSVRTAARAIPAARAQPIAVRRRGSMRATLGPRGHVAGIRTWSARLCRCRLSQRRSAGPATPYPG